MILGNVESRIVGCSILLFLDHWNILYTSEMFSALVINQLNIRKGFMPNDHCTSFESSPYKAYLLFILMNFGHPVFVLLCFSWCLVKLILKSHYIFNPHFKFICWHEVYILFFCLGLKACVSVVEWLYQNVVTSISVGGSLLLEILFSPAIGSLGSFGT